MRRVMRSAGALDDEDEDEDVEDAAAFFAACDDEGCFEPPGCGERRRIIMMRESVGKSFKLDGSRASLQLGGGCRAVGSPSSARSEGGR